MQGKLKLNLEYFRHLLFANIAEWMWMAFERSRNKTSERKSSFFTTLCFVSQDCIYGTFEFILLIIVHMHQSRLHAATFLLLHSDMLRRMKINFWLSRLNGFFFKLQELFSNYVRNLNCRLSLSVKVEVEEVARSDESFLSSFNRPRTYLHNFQSFPKTYKKIRTFYTKHWK